MIPSADRKSLQRLLSKTRYRSGGCWEWMAAVDPTGYGRFYFDGQMAYAHRVSYELHVAPIPEGLDIDHLCRNRACVNPDHLEPVTRRENLMRGDTIAAAHHRGDCCGYQGCRSCDAQFDTSPAGDAA